MYGRRGISCLAGGSGASSVHKSCPGRTTPSPPGTWPPQPWGGSRQTHMPPQSNPAVLLGELCSARRGSGASKRRGAATATRSTPAAAPTSASQPGTTCVKAAPGGSGGGAPGKDDWRDEVITALAQAEGFAELTIRAKAASAQPWHTITVRPVVLRGGRHLQVTTFTARQSTAANHPVGRPGEPEAVGSVVRPLLQAAGVGSVALRTAAGGLAVQITKRGKGIVHRTTPQARPALVVSEPGGGGNLLAHDRSKELPIPADQPHPFLQKIGFQTADGRIKANMQDKFSQVNEFLKLLGHTGLVRELLATTRQPASQPQTQQGQRVQADGPACAPLHILDCGCGSSHLSFGTYHYLNHVLGLPASLGGVDVNAALMRRANDNAAQLGLEGVRFETAPIGEYTPPLRPDIVLALHACDTATDDALALAVKQASPLVMAVPCCHAHLHKQLSGRAPASRPPWAPLLRHGILRQRQLDLLTDTLRAQLLRVAGYHTDVVEFVSTEHTPRNLLIRAVRQPPPQQRQGQEQQQRQQHGWAQPGSTPAGRDSGASVGPLPAAAAAAAAAAPTWRRQQLAAAREYLELRDYWGVVPRLEVLLRDELGPLLAAAAAQQPPSRGSEDEDSAGVQADEGGEAEP